MLWHGSAHCADVGLLWAPRGVPLARLPDGEHDLPALPVRRGARRNLEVHLQLHRAGCGRHQRRHGGLPHEPNAIVGLRAPADGVLGLGARPHPPQECREQGLGDGRGRRAADRGLQQSHGGLGDRPLQIGPPNHKRARDPPQDDALGRDRGQDRSQLHVRAVGAGARTHAVQVGHGLRAFKEEGLAAERDRTGMRGVTVWHDVPSGPVQF
mmetsp:Transcript_103381/g.296910  ORF Transcript_103381/g.296910 Transcript_103381/m.296910 type:complete len:211 (+) Transcript_103381:574-1206(+)